MMRVPRLTGGQDLCTLALRASQASVYRADERSDLFFFRAFRCKRLDRVCDSHLWKKLRDHEKLAITVMIFSAQECVDCPCKSHQKKELSRHAWNGSFPTLLPVCMPSHHVPVFEMATLVATCFLRDDGLFPSPSCEQDPETVYYGTRCGLTVGCRVRRWAVRVNPPADQSATLVKETQIHSSPSPPAPEAAAPARSVPLPAKAAEIVSTSEVKVDGRKLPASRGVNRTYPKDVLLCLGQFYRSQAYSVGNFGVRDLADCVPCALRG